jgi:fatty acid amide hydrolase
MASESAVEVLRAAGANVVEFTPARALDVWEIQLGQFYADGGKWIRQVLGRSKVDPRIKKTLFNASLPTLVRRSVPPILEAVGQTTLAGVLRRTRSHHLSAYGYQAVLEQQHAFRNAFRERLNQQQIDVLICPPFATAAVKHMSPDVVLAVAYTMVYNLLGMPAGVVPVKTVRADEECDRRTRNDDVVRSLLNAEKGSAGMPVGVQIVARHWREDVALAVMGLLHDKFQTQPDFPVTPHSISQI